MKTAAWSEKWARQSKHTIETVIKSAAVWLRWASVFSKLEVFIIGLVATMELETVFAVAKIYYPVRKIPTSHVMCVRTRDMINEYVGVVFAMLLARIWQREYDGETGYLIGLCSHSLLESSDLLYPQKPELIFVFYFLLYGHPCTALLRVPAFAAVRTLVYSEIEILIHLKSRLNRITTMFLYSVIHWYR